MKMKSFILVVTVVTFTITQSIRVPIYSNSNHRSILPIPYYAARGLPVYQPVASPSYIWLPFSTTPSPSYLRESSKNTYKKSKTPKKYQEEVRELQRDNDPEPLPSFLIKIHENDPFRRNGEHYNPEDEKSYEEEAENYKVPQESIPTSEHEFPLEIPTRPIYPGEGQWARPGTKHKILVRPTPKTSHKDYTSEDPPSEGYEIFENGEARFNTARDNFDSKSENFVASPSGEEEEEEEDTFDESSSPQIGFIPRKTYAQTRHSEETHHLPQSEAIKAASTQEELINAPRLREVIKNTKSRVVYTEEGYEDSAYDHAGHEKKAEDHLNFNLHEDDLHKDKKQSKKFYKNSNGDEGTKKYGSNDERRLINHNSEALDEEHEDQSEYQQGETKRKGKISKYRKTKPKRGKISAQASQKNIKIEKPHSGWIETNVAKDVEETIITNSEEGNIDWTQLNKNNITHNSYSEPRLSIHKLENSEKYKNLTSELLSLDLEKNISETSTPIVRVKRYNREKLSKIYIRKRPIYYWEKNKNKTTISTAAPQKADFGKPTSIPPHRKTFQNLRTRRTAPKLDDIDDLIYKIEDVRNIPLPKPMRDLNHIKYPYYLQPETSTLNRHSPLRYAENLKNIPQKSEGGLEFYESRSHIQCPEIEPNLDPIPDHIKNQDEDAEDTEDKMVPLNKPPIQRLKGLGDKIDCLKVKYFGANPLDSPFFKETEIPLPSLEEVFKKQPKFKKIEAIHSKNNHKGGEIKSLDTKDLNQRYKRDTEKSAARIIVVDEDEPIVTSTTEPSVDEVIEYLTLPPPTSSTEKMTEAKVSKKMKKKIRIRRPNSTTPSSTTTLPTETTTVDFREDEKRRAIEINELFGSINLENSETTINAPTEQPIKVSKRRSKILDLHRVTTEVPISTTSTPKAIAILEAATTETSSDDLEKDVVFFVDTEGENILDIPLQLPLVGNSTFGETFDINQYFPKVNITYDQSETPTSSESKATSRHQDQMNVFSDVLQHFQEESEGKDKRAIKAPRRKQRMRVIKNQDNINAENKQIESYVAPAENSQSTFLKHENLVTKAIYEPEKEFDKIPEFSNNPDHGSSYDIKEDQREEIFPEEEKLGDPNDTSYFPIRDSQANPIKYDLVYNHILNSYTLKPNSVKEESPKPNSYYSYRNVNTKDEETIVHGLQPVRYETGIKFIIPQKMIPQPHVDQFRAIVRPSTSASSPQIRFLIKPKVTKTIHLPPIEMMQSLADNLAARHRVRSADFVNIPGMHPPPMGQSLRINYSSYYPQTFDFLRASGSQFEESVVDLNGNPLRNVAQSRKYTEINQSNRQANFFRPPEEVQEATTVRNLIVLAAISRDKSEKESKLDVSQIQPNNSRLIASTVIPFINSSGLLLRDSYGSVLVKPSLQAFSTVVEENHNHSVRIMNESHEPVTYVNANYPEKNPQEQINATVMPKRSFSNFNRRRRPITTTLKPSTTTDQRRGEPRYSDTPVRSKYSSRTRKEFNTSALSNPELAVFKMVQTPEVFDINTYIPRTNILNLPFENSTAKPPEVKTRYSFSSRFKANEQKLPLPPEETLQTPFVVNKSVNLTQTGSEIQPRVIHLSRRHEEKTSTTTPETLYKIRRRRPIVSASVKNKTETSTVRSRVKNSIPETTVNRTRTRTSSRHRVPVDAVALLQKSRNSNSKKLKIEETPPIVETKSAMSKVVIITPSPTEDLPKEVEIFGNTESVKNGPKHGGNYRSINDENETKTKQTQKSSHKDHHRYVEDDPEETLGLENSDLVEIIGNYDAIRNGPKHGGNYRHINDQKYENSNHNSGVSHDEDYSDVDPRTYKSNFDYDRNFAESKHEEDSVSDLTTTSEITPSSTKTNQYSTRQFYVDHTLPHKVNNLKTKAPQDFDVDVDYDERDDQETQQQRPAFWSKVERNPRVREYFYSRS